MSDHDDEQQPPRSGPPPSEPSGRGGREAAWDDVAAQFSNLGQQVRNRFERPGGTSPSARDTSGGETVRRWIDTLDDTFTKLGDTVRDPAFRRDAGSSVGQLGQALGATLSELGNKLQGRFGREHTGTGVDDAGEDMPDVPPPSPPATGPDDPPTAGAGDPPTTGPDDIPPA